ncbi:sodium/hydrogen antiporter [Pararobbsia alpina]|uniref:cation:proton antiporter n=1 Tax=Pararobbsia alpina TaxID=621374 RepID=UPI0039A5D02F
MTIEAIWFILIGALLTFMALAGGPIRRLPLTGAMIYIVVGFVAGPAVLGLVGSATLSDPRLLRMLAETGLVVSLFAIGMHLRLPLTNPLWRWPIRLGVVAMAVSIGLLAVIGVYGLGLSVGSAIFLAAALAPTDPVLANELRVQTAGDDEPVRFALSGEGGLNDGAAYPMAILGLALCGAHPFGTHSRIGFALSALWGIAGALLLGWLLSWLFAKIVFSLRTRFREAIGFDGFLALGLTLAAYGAALLIHTYAFIAVFAAGVALRREEMRATGTVRPEEVLEDVPRGARHDVASDPERAHAYMAEAMLEFTVEIERLAEFFLMVLIGCVVSAHWRELLDFTAWLPALCLFFVARPLATAIAMAGSRAHRGPRRVIGWMGIRGVGAFYYAMFGIEQAGPQLSPILPAVLATIVLSVFLHGATAGFVLDRYFDRGGASAR